MIHLEQFKWETFKSPCKVLLSTLSPRSLCENPFLWQTANLCTLALTAAVDFRSLETDNMTKMNGVNQCQWRFSVTIIVSHSSSNLMDQSGQLDLLLLCSRWLTSQPKALSFVQDHRNKSSCPLNPRTLDQIHHESIRGWEICGTTSSLQFLKGVCVLIAKIWPVEPYWDDATPPNPTQP